MCLNIVNSRRTECEERTLFVCIRHSLDAWFRLGSNLVPTWFQNGSTPKPCNPFKASNNFIWFRLGSTLVPMRYISDQYRCGSRWHTRHCLCVFSFVQISQETSESLLEYWGREVLPLHLSLISGGGGNQVPPEMRFCTCWFWKKSAIWK